MLLQKGLAFSPLWSNEGVDRVARELHFIQPIKFGNIFLGIVGLHLEIFIMDCYGKFLEKSGVNNVLVENEIYRPKVVNSMRSGSRNVCGKRGMSMIAEVLGNLQLSTKLNLIDIKLYLIPLLKCCHCLKQMNRFKRFCSKRGKDVKLILLI